MACFTRVLVNVDDTALNRKARANLGIAETGAVTPAQAQQIRQEAGVLKAIIETRRLNPTAVIKRQGNQLTVQVMV